MIYCLASSLIARILHFPAESCLIGAHCHGLYSHMHTYDHINLAKCSLATRVRFYHPALSIFKAQHLQDDLELQTHVRTDPNTMGEGGREQM